jgi:hypothetical protein
MSVTAVAYIGTALPAAAATVTLFSTVASFGMADAIAMNGIERVSIDLFADHDGTFDFYKSPDRGVTWHQIDTLAFTGSAIASKTVDFLVEPYRDFKVDFTVGGSDETVFDVSVALSTDRARG